MTAPESVLARIERVLASAEDFRRHGEDGSADAALARAEAMMLRYAVDAALLAQRDAAREREEFDELVTDFTGIYRHIFLLGASELLGALGTIVVFQDHRVGGERISRLRVVGHASDVQHARVLGASIQTQCLAALERWWRTAGQNGPLTPMERFKNRREFIYRFYVAAAERVKRALGELRAEPGTDVVLRSRFDDARRYVNALYDLVNQRTSWRRGGRDAADAGRSAGERAVTGEPQVGPTRRQITS